MDDSFNGFLVGILIGMVIMAIATYNIMNNHWEGETVKKGYAEYNQTNGNWQWK
jgi:hypothetical protein